MRRVTAVLVAASALLAAPGVATAQEELSTSDHLEDRRYVAAGDRAQVLGFEDGSFQAQGWHIEGEMGGVWTPPLKLVDGVWFGVEGEWLGPATTFTSRWGSTRMAFPDVAGLQVTRTDFAPDGRRAAIFGLRLHNPGAARTVEVMVDAHSELLGQYPWGFTTPSAEEHDAADTGAFTGDALEFRDTGTPASGPREWVAYVGSGTAPVSGVAGPGHWGPQGPPELCAPELHTCDDGPFGRGTGGQLRYELSVPAGGSRTLWVAVAGSDEGAAAARAELDAALADPGAALREKHADRRAWSRFTRLTLPGDERLARAIDWGKQNLLDLTQRATDLEIRDVDEGRAYPPPAGTVDEVRWVGAGWPDYPWIFATDAEYTAFASVSVGQFEAMQDHARALRDVSVIVNGDTGKVVHEVTADGAVYFGANDDPGNTDETAKFPSLVALLWRWTGDEAFLDDLYPFTKRNMEHVVQTLDADGDGWPEGRGNVEREGMGEEKLDSTVYTIRGLYDLADMARAQGDAATVAWARRHASRMRARFEPTWWLPGPRQYADSLEDPGNVPLFQKHWIGQTPMEAELRLGGGAWPGIAAYEHGTAALEAREDPCYSGERPYNLGLFHTGCGGGPEGAGEQSVFSLNTAIQAVGEGNYGRLGPGQQQRYTDANAEPMFAEPYASERHTPGTPDEQPGALPEILPSPGFDPEGDEDANMDRCTRCRSMFMQAWGHYGTMWPVVHQQLGVRPDLGRGIVTVVPQLPGDEPIAGRRIRLGDGALALVRASKPGTRYRTVVDTGDAPVRRLVIGHTLPRSSEVGVVRLDGERVEDPRVRTTNRGVEVTVGVKAGRHVLEVRPG